MKRKVVGIALFCLVLLGAVLAGYWDMLDTEQLRLARDRTSEAIGEMAGLVDPAAEGPNASGPAPAPAAGPRPVAAVTPPAGAAVAPTIAAPPPAVADAESKPAEAADGEAAPKPDAARAAATEPPAREPATPRQPTSEAPAPEAPAPGGATLDPDTAVAAAAGAPTAPDAATAPAASPEAAALPPKDAAPQPAEADGAAAMPAPTFDILRVEPDGSTVMAGRAPAGTTVRLTDGTSTIGSQTAGPGGDFVVVLETPLPVGDHQIRIEATDTAGRSVTSAETAIVSVPEPGREGELLALVETPEQPSRLISLPEGRAGPDPAAALGTQVPVEDAPAAGEADRAQAPAEAPAAADAPNPAAASRTPPEGRPAEAAPPAQETAAAAARLPSEPEIEPAGGGPAAATDPGALAVEAVEIEDETIYVAGRAPAGPTIRVYVDNRFLAEHSGRDTERFLVTTRSTVAPGDHVVRADQIGPDGTVLSRVEVPFFKPEGRTMAAVSPSEGTRSRSEPLSAENTAERDVAPAPGRIAAAGAPVEPAAPGAEPPPIAEPGPAAATAVAPDRMAPPASNGERPPPASLEERMAVAETPAASPPVAETPAASPPVAETPGTEAAAPSPSPSPSPASEAVAAGAREPETAQPAETAALPSPVQEAEQPAPAPAASVVLQAPPAQPLPAPRDVPAVDGAPAAPADPAPASPSTSGAPSDASPAGDARVADAPAPAPAPEAGRFGEGGEGGVAATRQAPLEAATARVIIRRGDTLWRISRDTYGLGARYTVIYLANGDQIRNPNRIYPGQVFRMPEDRTAPAAPAGVE